MTGRKQKDREQTKENVQDRHERVSARPLREVQSGVSTPDLDGSTYTQES